MTVLAAIQTRRRKRRDQLSLATAVAALSLCFWIRPISSLAVLASEVGARRCGAPFAFSAVVAASSSLLFAESTDDRKTTTSHSELYSTATTKDSIMGSYSHDSRTNLRIVNYNLLSSRLSVPDFYTTCAPENLEEGNRLAKILKKLTQEMDEARRKKASVVFCLQEVSIDWVGPLHSYFANRGYHFVTALYGKKPKNYMGQGIAYSLQDFETVAVHVERLSETRQEGWPRPPPVALPKRMLNTLGNLLTTATRLSTGLVMPAFRTILQLEAPQPPPLDHWKASEGRLNQLVTVGLKKKEKEDSSIFYVSTYHMPCLYYAPMVMTIHVDLALGRAQLHAGEHPLVFAGDFNLKPDSAQYQMITSLADHGGLPESHPEYPTSKCGMEWKPSQRQSMRSAYAVANQGKEPDFTTFAEGGNSPVFIDTLDYIFVSEQWEVDGVGPLPHRDAVKGPFPNDVEPSDHVLISADLSLAPKDR